MSKAAELANLIGNINAGGGGVNRNVIINGAMNVAQRATSATGIGASGAYFTVDRFKIEASSGNSGRLTMTQDSSVPTGKGFANSTKLDCTTADTSIAAGEFLIFRQSIEGQNLQGFAKGTSEAKPFTLSFYVKGNASATYVAELADTDNSRTAGKSFNVTTDWTRVELTFAADTTGAFDDDNATSLELSIWLHAGSTYNDPSGTLQQTFASTTNSNRAVGISSFFDSTDRTFFITGVQLEVGQNPTSFEHEPFDVTLEKCRRYYHQFYYSSTASNAGYSNSYGMRQNFRMRAQPSASVGSGSKHAYPGNVQNNSSMQAEVQFLTQSNVGHMRWYYSGNNGITYFDAQTALDSEL